MTDDRSLERAARSWLEEGPTRAPDDPVEAALSRIDMTSQERDLRIPWRFPTMNPITRIVASAAVGVAAIALAVLVLRPGSDVGSPPSATPAIPTPPAASIVGTWDVTFTPQDMLDAGVIGHVASDPDDSGHFRMTFSTDQWQLSHLSPAIYVTPPEKYTADPGVIHIGQPGDTSFNTPVTITATTVSFGPQAPTWFSIRPWSRVSTEPFASPIPRPRELQSGDVGSPLEPGRYRVRGFAVPLLVTLPPGWRANGLAQNSVGFELASSGISNVGLFVLDGVYADPCHPSADPQPVGPGVDGVVEALAAIKDFSVTDVREVTVGGAHGEAFLFGNDINPEGCADTPMPFGTSDKNGDGQQVDVPMFGGETDRFWALDVDGTTIVIAITDTPTIVADTQPVFDSLAFGDGST